MFYLRFHLLLLSIFIYCFDKLVHDILWTALDIFQFLFIVSNVSLAEVFDILKEYFQFLFIVSVYNV